MVKLNYAAVARKPRKRHNSEEAVQQIHFVRWCRYHPQLCNIAYHVPNGGSRNKIEAAKFKSLGVLAGVCDIVLPIPNSLHHGLYIEFKSQSGKVQESQQKFINAISNNGYKAVVCRSSSEAIAITLDYLGT